MGRNYTTNGVADAHPYCYFNYKKMYPCGHAGTRREVLKVPSCKDSFTFGELPEMLRAFASSEVKMAIESHGDGFFLEPKGEKTQCPVVFSGVSERDIANCDVLIVDDVDTNIATLGHVLGGLCKSSGSTTAEIAFESLSYVVPDLILLDLHMPGMNGFELCHRVMSTPSLCDVPVIFITADNRPETLDQAFALGAVDYITKPFDPAEVQARVRTHLRLRLTEKALRAQNDILESKVFERTKSIQEKQDEIEEVKREAILRLCKAAELRDKDTGLHIRRIQNITEFIARKIGIKKEDANRLALASAMHDIGKIGIPDSILLKPGKLTDTEFETMKTHTTVGAAILSGSQYKLLNVAEVVARHHHEKWDGTGYPCGLKGQNIPLEARIVAVVDCFDAMLSRRPYKSPMEPETVVDIMKKGRGTEYDPDILDALLNNIGSVMSIREAFV